MKNATLTLLALSLLVGCRAQSSSDGGTPSDPTRAQATVAPAGSSEALAGGGSEEASSGASSGEMMTTVIASSEPTATPVEGRVEAASQPALTATVVQARRSQTPQDAPQQAGDLWAALAASDWPPSLWSRVHAIVMCESRSQTTAVSPGGHVGLMQVDPKLHGPVPSDAVGQLNDAYEVYLKQGWQAWSCA
jgi:hypothetical protein